MKYISVAPMVNHFETFKILFIHKNQEHLEVSEKSINKIVHHCCNRTLPCSNQCFICLWHSSMIKMLHHFFNGTLPGSKYWTTFVKARFQYIQSENRAPLLYRHVVKMLYRLFDGTLHYCRIGIIYLLLKLERFRGLHQSFSSVPKGYADMTDVSITSLFLPQGPLDLHCLSPNFPPISTTDGTPRNIIFGLCLSI